MTTMTTYAMSGSGRVGYAATSGWSCFGSGFGTTASDELLGARDRHVAVTPKAIPTIVGVPSLARPPV